MLRLLGKSRKSYESERMNMRHEMRGMAGRKTGKGFANKNEEGGKTIKIYSYDKDGKCKEYDYTAP